MKNHLLTLTIFCFAIFGSFAQQNALLSNGRLKVIGKQLSNQCGNPVQLRGMSTHAPMGHQNCYKASSVAALANDWGSDVLRLAMYTADVGESKGYVNGDRAFWDNWIDEMVDLAEDNGMYVIIDWHILSDNNPYTNISTARTFFSKMSAKYKNRRHVIYEICNEPNGGVSWGTIKSYAEEIIPLIRANDPEGIILVGTPEWSSRPQDAAANPLTGSNAYNVMYTVHFYANTHYWHSDVSNAASKIPIFASEWGSVDASGNGGFNQGNSDTWLNLLNNASGQKISWCNWAFVDKNEAASALNPGACLANNWSNRSTAGTYVYNKMRVGDNFSACAAAGDSDGDGVTNGEDQCPGTPANSYVDARGCIDENDSDGDGVVDQDDNCPGTAPGTVVNAVGCEIANDFISNVCMGFNNVQNYVRSDFNYEYANLFAWNTTVGESSVYYAQVKNGELQIQTTNADPNYAAMGISFGEEEEDGRLVQFDMSAQKVIEMDLRFDPTSYSANDVLFRIQIEDADGNVINSDPTGLDHRQLVPINTWKHVSFDFEDGLNILWDANQNCSPCTLDVFDFTRVTKVIMFCNPGAGETWSRPRFTGNWRIDNFSAGYIPAIHGSQSCDALRDDDGDGVREEFDKCRFTITGAAVDTDGCAEYQLDSDDDGVSDADDVCPNTPVNTAVNSVGCDASVADDDEDGILNKSDSCPATPSGETVNNSGCSQSQLDDDNDGVANSKDLCASTPSGQSVDANGCAASQLDSDNDGVGNALDLCPNTPSNQNADVNGCSYEQRDDDNDGTSNGVDGCPTDRNKIQPGTCGCGVADTDSDTDGTPDCNDLCPQDKNKTAPGSCGCGVVEGTCVDCNGVSNGTAILDACQKCVGGTTGQTSDDADNDGTLDCNDQCPNDPNKIVAGACGCGVAEGSCQDCAGVVNGTAYLNECEQCVGGTTGKTGDADNDGVLDCNDACPNDPNKKFNIGACGCGNIETDGDNDNVADCIDQCPNDPNKSIAGDCGCGVPEGTCNEDCAGVSGGSAFIDNCGTCVAGTTGKIACEGILEGEDYCEIDGVTSSSNGGFFGSGYANFDNLLGASATWVLHSYEDQTVTFKFRHTYGATDNRNTEVFVNGVSQGIIPFTNTGGWGVWADVSYDLDLLKGSNNITLVSVSTDGGSNIDRITWGQAAVIAGSCDTDCDNVIGGRAYEDVCGKCVGGLSGEQSADGDNDGVLDCEDQCPNTTIGAKIDNTGCDVTAISSKLSSGVSLYPTPVFNELSVAQTFNLYDKITITSVSGVIMYEGVLQSSIEQVSLENFNQGIYIVQLSNATGSEQFRIVKY